MQKVSLHMVREDKPQVMIPRVADGSARASVEGTPPQYADRHAEARGGRRCGDFHRRFASVPCDGCGAKMLALIAIRCCSDEYLCRQCRCRVYTARVRPIPLRSTKSSAS